MIHSDNTGKTGKSCRLGRSGKILGTAVLTVALAASLLGSCAYTAKADAAKTGEMKADDVETEAGTGRSGPVEIKAKSGIGKSFVIHFDANGGEGTMPDQVVEPDDRMQRLEASTFTNKGKSFRGWEFTPNSVYPDYAIKKYDKKVIDLSDLDYHATGHEVTLYAVWGNGPASEELTGNLDVKEYISDNRHSVEKCHILQVTNHNDEPVNAYIVRTYRDENGKVAAVDEGYLHAVAPGEERINYSYQVESKAASIDYDIIAMPSDQGNLEFSSTKDISWEKVDEDTRKESESTKDEPSGAASDGGDSIMYRFRNNSDKRAELYFRVLDIRDGVLRNVGIAAVEIAPKSDTTYTYQPLYVDGELQPAQCIAGIENVHMSNVYDAEGETDEALNACP